MATPLLSNFPHLHQLLRNDPRANADFNAIISQIRTPVGTAERDKELRDSLDAERTLRAELQEKLTKLADAGKKTVRFIKVLGEVIEPQVSLRPYSQDVSEKKSYDIRFSANQIRMALKLHWDVMSDSMEATFTNEVVDPVDDAT